MLIPQGEAEGLVEKVLNCRDVIEKLQKLAT